GTAPLERKRNGKPRARSQEEPVAHALWSPRPRENTCRFCSAAFFPRSDTRVREDAWPKATETGTFFVPVSGTFISSGKHSLYPSRVCLSCQCGLCRRFLPLGDFSLPLDQPGRFRPDDGVRLLVDELGQIVVPGMSGFVGAGQLRGGFVGLE